MHGLIQVLVQPHKSILALLIGLYQAPSGQTSLMSIHAYCCQEHEGTPSAKRVIW